jgi:1,4-alpha-glucan branching enzyme
MKANKMSPETAKSKIYRRRVTFSLKAARAKRVSLLGDFNNWDAGATPMKRDKDGIWKSTLILSAGRYEFKFLLDGKWREASKAEPSVPNAFGTLNNVLVIEEKPK